MIKKIGKIILWFFAVLLVLSIAFLVAVRYPAFQTYLAHRVTDVLTKSLDTKVSIDRVELSFFNKADLVNFYMEDHNHDTLISAKELKIQFKVFELLKRKINVHSILLDGGSLYLHRDSTGQKLNLTEVFKTKQSNTQSPPISTGNKTAALKWDIDLQELDLHNAAFRYWDEKNQSDLKVNVASCAITVNDFDLQKKLAYIKSIQIDGANVSVDLRKHAMDSAKAGIKEEFHLMSDGMKLTFDEIAVTNSRFVFNNYKSDSIVLKGIDFNHLDLAKINFRAQQGAMIADTISANIESLSATEKSGFILQNLTAETKFSVNALVFDKLNIKTPNSHITDYLSFRYNSLDDFSDFFNAVRIKAKLDHTKFSLKDLNYFIKNLDKVEHNQFLVSGEIDGRINNLKGRGIEITTADNTIFKGDFYSRGLPNVFETSINVNVGRLATTAADIKKIYPLAIIPNNLNTLGLIYYTGTFDGFVTDFVSKGKFVTSIGSATTDVDFKYNKETNKASYDGSLALNEFNLGAYFNSENILGKVSLETKIKGGGLTAESLNAQLEGNISSITIKGYDYRDLKINGSVLKKSFNGLLEVRDKYLDMDFNGKADLTNKTPAFNFDAIVRKADLKNLNITKDDIRVAGKMTSDFAGSNIDDMVGSVKLNNVTISRDSATAQVKYFDIEAKLLSNQKKEITLNSDFAEAEMSGNFTLEELPKALINFGKHTFTKDYVDTSSVKIPQNFALDFRLYEPGNLLPIIYPKITALNSSRLTCDFNSVNHTINLYASIPEFGYGDFDIRRAEVIAHSTDGKFDVSVLAGRVYKGDSVMLDSVMLATRREGNDIRFDLKASDEAKNNYAKLTAFITPLKDKTIVRLEPGDIRLGGSNWRFDPGDSIFIEGKKVTSKNLVFRSDNQTVYINSYLKNDSSTSLKLVLDNTNLDEFSKTVATKSKEISGIMNGKLIIEDIFNTPEVYGDFVISDFKLGDELIGDINVDSRLDSSRNNVNIFASVKSINNNIEARGHLSIDPDHPDLKIDIDAKRLGLNVLNYKFFDRYVKNVKGYATANATIYGTLKNPLLKGKVNLVDDTVTVTFLNTTYTLHNQSAKLDEHGFDLDGIVINDIHGKEAYGSGRINHESFRDFNLDVKVSTQNPYQYNQKNVVQFINTTEKESPGFYGVAYGTGYVTFSGSINSPVINAVATTGRDTYCKLPVNSSYETNRYSFYKFIGHGKDTIITNKPGKVRANGVTFTLNLTATNDARMDILLDPIAGDLLTGYGNGDLKIAIAKTGEISMYGSYEIDRGTYKFTMQNVVNKQFLLDKGGTINFDGQVYRAKLNLNAVYEIRTSLTYLIEDMIGSASTNNPALNSAMQSRAPVDLLLKINGVLERPQVSFDIKVVDPDPNIKSYVDQKMTLLRANETEMNKQVFGLLVMNQFIPTSVSTQNTIANTSYAGSTAANTVSEFLSSQFSNYLGNLLEFANIKNLDFNVGYKQSDQLNTNPASISGTTNAATLYKTYSEFQFALQKKFFDQRLSISAGGNLDFGADITGVSPSGQSGSSNKSVIPTGDFQVSYSLTPDGGWRAKAFNRTDYDYYNARNTNKTGVGISYRQEFDKPSDLFKKKDKKKVAPKIELKTDTQNDVFPAATAPDSTKIVK